METEDVMNSHADEVLRLRKLVLATSSRSRVTASIGEGRVSGDFEVLGCTLEGDGGATLIAEQASLLGEIQLNRP